MNLNRSIYKSIVLKRALSYIAIGIIVAACGGGSGGGSSNPSTASGVFLDSAVEGITYMSGNTTGVTDANGTFQYEVGNTVRFTIGDIVIGEAPGDAVITPVDFVNGSDASNSTVLNIVSCLLTLDEDGNPDNGIQISDTVKNLARGMSIDFAQGTTAFAADGDVQVAISQLTAATTAGARSLVSSSSAQNHVSNTIFTIYAGNYSGTFTGSDSGTFDATVFSDGSIIGTGFSAADGNFTTIGQLTTDGSVSLTQGGTSTGASFLGEISNNTLSGTWQNGVFSGTFTGDLINGSGNNTGGTGGSTGSLTITGSSQVPSSYTPDSNPTAELGASEGFLQTQWIDTNSFWSLTASIADNYGNLSGAVVTFGINGAEYSCESGFFGSYGNCSGTTYDHSTRTVMLTNVELQAAGSGTVITLNGSLVY